MGMRQVLLTRELRETLHHKGIHTSWEPDRVTLPLDCRFEPPCSMRWMAILHSCTLGAFSYAVSGYYFACRIGRYVSIGEDMQAGRGDHPLDWLSTSPFLYLPCSEVVSVGRDFPGAEEYHREAPRLAPGPHKIEPVEIGHDVWIGHGVYIKPGVKIGNGAIVAAKAVVTKDIPAYAIAAGNPCRVKKMRFRDERIERLEALRWWRYAIWDLQGVTINRIEAAIDQLGEKIALGTLRPYDPGFVSVADLAVSAPPENLPDPF